MRSGRVWFGKVDWGRKGDIGFDLVSAEELLMVSSWGWQTRVPRPNLNQCLFLQIKFYWNMATLIRLHAIIYSRFHATMAELNSCDRDSLAHEAKNIYHMVLYRKHLPTSSQRACKMCKGFRILALRRVLTDVYQCVHLPRMPLSTCYLEHHLCYSSRREGKIKQP